MHHAIFVADEVYAASRSLWNGDPYMLHPINVMRYAQLTAGERTPMPEEERLMPLLFLCRERLLGAAIDDDMTEIGAKQLDILHDVIELGGSDVPLILDQLERAGLLESGVSKHVQAMSLPSGLSKVDKVLATRQIALGFKGNIPRLHKTLDNVHNLDPWRHPQEREPSYRKNAVRYLDSLDLALGRDHRLPDALKTAFNKPEFRALVDVFFATRDQTFFSAERLVELGNGLAVAELSS